jgi:hypothetical protein
MPLEKKPTDEAFKRNVSAEIDAGRPRDQALAIAYSTKRQAGGEANDAKKKALAQMGSR